MQVISKPYSNPKEDVERFVVVDVKYKKTLKRPVTLDEMKKREKIQKLGINSNFKVICNASTQAYLGCNCKDFSKLAIIGLLI